MLLILCSLRGPCCQNGPPAASGINCATLLLASNQVQNGIALYATWGTLCTLLNLTIFLQHNSGASRCDCAMLSLLLLLMTLLAWWASPLRSVAQLLPSTHPLQGDHAPAKSLLSSSSSYSPLTPRFLLENFWLDKHVRYIVATHPVVILWLAGTLSNSDSPGSQVYIFTGSFWHPHTWLIHFFSLFTVYWSVYCTCFISFFLLQLQFWLFLLWCL